MFFFFFKQKTAYEMRISDWSSDVCSSDLFGALVRLGHGGLVGLASNLEVGRIDVHDGTTSHPNQGCQLVNATRKYGLAKNRTPEVGASAGRSVERGVGDEGVSTCRTRW